MSIDSRIRALNQDVSFNKKSYTVQEVIQILGTTRQSIYKLIDEGCFRAVKVENGYRIYKNSFDEWLEGKDGIA